MLINPCAIYNKAKNNYGLGYEKTANILKTKYILDKIASLLDDKFKGVYDPSNLQEETESFFLNPDSGFYWKHDQQAKEQAIDTTRQILRYVNSENRKPVYFDGKEIVMPTGKAVYVRPTEVFITTNSKGQRIIEVVKIKTSKPKITQRQAENGAESAIELFELIKFGQTLLNKKGEENVVASIYYLRKNSDRHADTSTGLNGNFDENFFNLKDTASSSNNGRNIIKIIESYRNGLKLTLDYNPKARTLKSFALPDYDKIFENACDHAYSKIDASECSPSLCENCPIKAMCPKHFTEAPLSIETEKETVKAKRMKLTPSQKAATDFDSGLCRINAGAGAGKTSVVKSHFMSLCEKGFDPTKILVITFTNSGAEEMRSRIVSGLKRNGIEVDPDSLWILTFNAFGDLLLKSNYYKLGYSIAPKLIDDIERSRIITEVLKENPVINGLDYKNFTLNHSNVKGALPTVATIFSLAKKYSLSYADYMQCFEMLHDKYAFSVLPDTCKKILKLYPKYDDKLRESNLIEFDDQIANIFEILYHEPDFFEKLGFEHIIVDEFQDTDQQQIDILKQLIDCPSFKSLMVVGDDSQAIYGFRDTSPDYIIHFEDYIGSPLTDIYLLENFRSTPEIIEFANKINNMNTSKIAKNLVATRPSGDPVTVVGFGDQKQEYSYIVEQIKQNINDGVKPEDIAFIGYTKSELRKMADLLSKEGITSVMMNPELLQENSRVLAGLAMLKALQNPADRKSLLTYASALNDKNIMELSFTKAQKVISFAESKLAECRRMPEPTKKVQIVELLKELDRNDDEVFEGFIASIEFKPTVAEMYDYAKDFEEFGDRAAIRRSHSYPGVVLTTAHSSKGLEWPIAYVSVSKFDDEVLSKKLETIEERRRLLFVSATRAKDRLVVTGTWVAYTTSDKYNPKAKMQWYNKYLLNAFEVIGEDFSDTDLKEIYTIYKTVKAEERQKEKLAKASTVLPKRTYIFNPRKMRSLRKKGRQTVKRHNRIILK